MFAYSYFLRSRCARPALSKLIPIPKGTDWKLQFGSVNIAPELRHLFRFENAGFAHLFDAWVNDCILRDLKEKTVFSGKQGKGGGGEGGLKVQARTKGKE